MRNQLPRVSCGPVVGLKLCIGCWPAYNTCTSAGGGGFIHNRFRMTTKLLDWILLGFTTVGLGIGGAAVTQAQCTELLQHALDDRNPDTRKQAVAALSLAYESGPLFTRLVEMLQDKDVEVR